MIQDSAKSNQRWQERAEIP